MFNRLAQAAMALSVLLGATPASAAIQIFVHEGRAIGPSGSQTFSSSDAQFAYVRDNAPNSMGAYADLALGKMGAMTSSAGGLGFNYSIATQVRVETPVSFHVEGGDENTVTRLYLPFSVEGTLQSFLTGGSNSSGYQFYGQAEMKAFLNIYTQDEFGETTVHQQYARVIGLGDGLYFNDETYLGWEDEAGYYETAALEGFENAQKSFGFDVYGADPSFFIEMSLVSLSAFGGVSDYYHTATLSLQAPADITVLSGDLFNAEKDIGFTPPTTVQYGAALSAAPEPSAWALMILGFGGVGAVLRRRATPGRPVFAG
jgi:hypothetical protein